MKSVFQLCCFDFPTDPNDIDDDVEEKPVTRKNEAKSIQKVTTHNLMKVIVISATMIWKFCS